MMQGELPQTNNMVYVRSWSVHWDMLLAIGRRGNTPLFHQ
jgi:hypothetical protein